MKMTIYLLIPLWLREREREKIKRKTTTTTTKKNRSGQFISSIKRENSVFLKTQHSK